MKNGIKYLVVFCPLLVLGCSECLCCLFFMIRHSRKLEVEIGGAILQMSASLNGTYLTVTVSKTAGGTFSSSGTMYLKVGTCEVYGTNRDSKPVYGGSTSRVTFTHNLDSFTDYPKLFYARYEPTSGGYACVGPITVSDHYPKISLIAPVDRASNLSPHRSEFQLVSGRRCFRHADVSDRGQHQFLVFRVFGRE